MAAMTKRVNITATTAVRSFKPPIYGTYNDVIMSTGDILKLLCKRAKVDEILPDGRLISLNMSNYYKDNGAGLNAYVNTNMDDKYNKNKDSKKNRGPIVDVKAAGMIPPVEINVDKSADNDINNTEEVESFETDLHVEETETEDNIESEEVESFETDLHVEETETEETSTYSVPTTNSASSKKKKRR